MERPLRLSVAVTLAALVTAASAPASAEPQCQRRAARAASSDSRPTTRGDVPRGKRGRVRRVLRNGMARAKKLQRTWNRRVIGVERMKGLDKANLSKAKQGLVRLLTRELFHKHGTGNKGRVYELEGIARIDSPASNPLTGNDNFLVVTMKNPRSKAMLSRAARTVSPTAQRKLVVKVNDAEALAKITDAQDGGSAEDDAISRAIDAGAIEVISDAPDAGIYRLMTRLGGKGSLRRLANDLRTSRGARGGSVENSLIAGVAGGAAVSPDPVTKAALGVLLVQRGVRAVRGVRRAVKRRKVALHTFEEVLYKSYVADYSNPARPVLRKSDKELGKGLPETINSVEEAHSVYREFVEEINKKAAVDSPTANDAPHTATYELSDFVNHFARLSFQRAP